MNTRKELARVLTVLERIDHDLMEHEWTGVTIDELVTLRTQILGIITRVDTIIHEDGGSV